MSDHADIAGDVVETCLDDALKRQLGKGTAPEFDPDFDGVNCIDCDCPIPAARLTMQKVRCVDCQHLFEQTKHRRNINVRVGDE